MYILLIPILCWVAHTGCSPITKNELNFLVLGDWGGQSSRPYKTDIEDHTAKQMAVTAKETSSKFVVALGDNFYKHGVKSVDDKRFQRTYENVFNQPSLKVPWYVIAGNHDHYGNVSAQVLYTQRHPLWRFPHYWHAQKWVIPGTNMTMKLVLLDTIMLCGNSGDDTDGEQPQGAENELLAEAQWHWLEDQLKHSKDDYLIVGGHFPVWSIAHHGPTRCLVHRLKPLLEKYNVNTYICGHDHNLQHLREDHSQVEYFIVGCANYISTCRKHSKYVPHHSSKFHWADRRRKGGFAHVRVSKSHMTFSLIDSLGGLLHKVDMKPRSV